jgi:hypothetical protein
VQNNFSNVSITDSIWSNSNNSDHSNSNNPNNVAFGFPGNDADRYNSNKNNAAMENLKRQLFSACSSSTTTPWSHKLWRTSSTTMTDQTSGMHHLLKAPTINSSVTLSLLDVLVFALG